MRACLITSLPRCVVIGVFVTCAVTCGRREAQPDLLPVLIPDMSRSDEAVQTQARERYAALTQKRESGAASGDLALAYGEVGMLMQATEYFDAAEPAYLNAETLAPANPRWVYYLAHVYRRQGDTTKAVEQFNRALDRQRTDVPTLVWLGRMLVDQGRAGEAEPLLVRAQSAAPRAVAVLADLGQVALARRDYAQAAAQLNAALSIDPTVLSLHAPLATAYRGLGETTKADQHSALWKNTEIPLADPLMDRVVTMVESGVSSESRGVRAFEAGKWAEAAALFRQGIDRTPLATPLGRSLRHKLGLALHLGGDARGAVEQFEEAIRLAPAVGLDEPAAQAHYGLAVVIAAQGRDAEAIGHLSQALRYSPKYVQAMVVLADVLRRSRRFEESLRHYRDAVRIDEQRTDARWGYGVALVRLRRDVEARRWFEDAIRAHPDQPELAHGLARVLAAAPDARVRDGQRALAILQPLVAVARRSDFGETMAMALAETGQYAEAVRVQRSVMQAAERAGLGADVQRMAANLRLYEQRMPCRTPWTDQNSQMPAPPV